MSGVLLKGSYRRKLYRACKTTTHGSMQAFVLLQRDAHKTIGVLKVCIKKANVDRTATPPAWCATPSSTGTYSRSVAMPSAI